MELVASVHLALQNPHSVHSEGWFHHNQELEVAQTWQNQILFFTKATFQLSKSEEYETSWFYLKKGDADSIDSHFKKKTGIFSSHPNHPHLVSKRVA